MRKFVPSVLMGGTLVFIFLAIAAWTSSGGTSNNQFLEGATIVLYLAGWLLALLRAGAAKYWGWFMLMLVVPVSILAYALSGARD